MQCTLTSVRNGKAASGGSARPDKGKGGKSGNGKAKKGGMGKEKDESRSRGECDKNGKPTGVNSLTATGATQPSSHAIYAPSAVGSMASTIPTQQMVPVYFPNYVGSQAFQQTETWFINITGPENSHGCKLGRSVIRFVGFWILLDILPNQLR